MLLNNQLESLDGDVVDFVRIRRALISVFDKTGLLLIAQSLAAMNVELISTGGTAQALRNEGFSVRDISEFTQSPEILDGRVKTLHPLVHGGLLFVRGNERHEKEIQNQGIQPIDLVIVNLYPFDLSGH
jgi:phosphoribosylaminoimidazolecarboxamide formyltransferase / IMP cyclohydrolase